MAQNAELMFLLKAQNEASPVFKQAQDDLRAMGAATGQLSTASQQLIDNNQSIAAGFAGTGATILDFKARAKEASEATQVHTQFVKEQIITAQAATKAVEAHTEAVKRNADAQKDAAKNPSGTPPLALPSSNKPLLLTYQPQQVEPPLQRFPTSSRKFGEPIEIDEAASALLSAGTKTTRYTEQLNAAKAAVAAGSDQVAKDFNPNPPGGGDHGGGEEHLRNMTHEAHNLRESLEEAGKAFVAAFVTNEIVRETVGAFAKAQEELLRLKQAADLTAEAIKEINEQSEKLSTTSVNLGSGEINQIATVAARVGVEGAEGINEFSKAVSEMAAITGTSGVQAANSIGKILIATNETKEGVKGFTNALSALGPKSLEGTQGLLSTTQALAQQTQGFKFTSTELLGLSAAVDKVTKRPELFARQFPELLTQLQVGAEKGTTAFELFSQKVGLTGDQFKELLQNNPAEAFQKFLGAVNSFGGDNNQIKAFLKEFGITGPQAVSTFTALSKNIPEYNKALKEASEASKDTAAQQNRLKDAMALVGPQATLAKNSLEALGEAIGEAAAPTAVAGLQLIAAGAQAVKEAFTSLPTIIQEVLGVTIAFGGAGVAIGAAWRPLTAVFSAILGPLRSMAQFLSGAAVGLAEVLTKTTVATEGMAAAAARGVVSFRFLATGISALTGPIGVAVAAATTGAVEIIRNWDDVKDFFRQISFFSPQNYEEFDKLKKKAEELIETLKKVPGVKLTGAVLGVAGDVLSGAPENTVREAIKNDEADRAAKEKQALKEAIEEADRLGKTYLEMKSPLEGQNEIWKLIQGAIAAATGDMAVLLPKTREITDLDRERAGILENHVKHLADAHAAAEAGERSQKAVLEILDSQDVALLKQLSTYEEQAKQIKEMTGALERAKSLAQGSAYQLGGKDASPELRSLLERRAEGQLDEKRKRLDPLYETIKQLDEQAKSEGAITREQKNQVELQQLLQREKEKTGYLTAEEAQRLAAAQRAVQAAQKASAINNEFFQLGQSLNVSKELTESGRQRAEITNKIAEFERQNGALTTAQRNTMRELLTLQNQLADAAALRSKYDPTAVATQEYQDELKRIDNLVRTNFYTKEQGDLLKRNAELRTREARDPLGEEVANMQREIDLLSVEPAKLESVRQAREKVLQLQKQGVDLTKEQQAALEKNLTVYNEELKKAQELNQSGFKGFAAGIKDADQQFADLQKSFAEGLSSSIAQALNEGFNGKNTRQIFLNFLKQFDAQVLKATIDGIFKKAIESDTGKGILGNLFGDPAKAHTDKAQSAAEAIEGLKKEVNDKLEQRIFNAQQATISVVNATITGLETALGGKLGGNTAANDNAGNSIFGPTGFSTTTKTLPAEAGGSTNQSGTFGSFGFSNINAGVIDSAVAQRAKVAVDEASKLIGTKEGPTIDSFLQSGGVNLKSASDAWCAAFVNANLQRVGLKGDGSNVATDFLNFGQKVGAADAQRGDIVVENRGLSAGQTGGHVGFFTGNRRGNQLEVLSGNSSDQVKTDYVDAGQVQIRRAVEQLRQSQSEMTQAITQGGQQQVAAVQAAEAQKSAALSASGTSQAQVVQANEDAKTAAYQTSSSAALEVENAHQSLGQAVQQSGAQAQAAAPEFTAAGNALQNAGSSAQAAQGGGGGGGGSTSSSGGLTGFASSIGQLTSTVGRAIPGVGGLVSQIGNLISQSAKLLSSGGGSSGGGGIGGIFSSILGGLGGGGGGGGGWSTSALNAIGAVPAGTAGGIPQFFYHDGGMVGDSPSFTRHVDPKVFAGAPRFHTGLMDDEFPAILQRGEQVISKSRVREMKEHTDAINDNLALSERLVANAQSGGMMAAGLSQRAAVGVGPASGQQVHQYHMPITIVAPNPDTYRQALPQIATQTKMAMDRAHRRNA